MSDMEQRLARLEDESAIRRLHIRFAHLGDKGWAGAGADPQALSALFTEDAVWQSANLGLFKGPAAIAAGLGGVGLATAVHLLAATEPDVDGDEAQGSWNVLLLLKTADNRTMIGAGTYLTRYRRQAQGWRIASMTMEPAVMTALA